MTAAGEPPRVEGPSALYARLLGPAWLDLQPGIRSLPLTDDAATGRFEFHHDRGAAARLARRVLRLPSSAALDVRLTIDRDTDSERWTRAFGRRRLVTTQRGLPDGALAERFGALEFRFRLRVVEGALTYVQAGAALSSGACVFRSRDGCPRGSRRERQAWTAGARTSRSVSLPLIGLVMSYEGRIERERP